MTSATGTRPPISELVAGELRAHMARQRKSLAELADVLGLKDRKSAKVRYDGHKSLTIEELELLAAWLEIDRSDLLSGEVSVEVAS